jgi:hypothetical protein
MISKEDEKRKKRFNAREVRMVYISKGRLQDENREASTAVTASWNTLGALAPNICVGMTMQGRFGTSWIGPTNKVTPSPEPRHPFYGPTRECDRLRTCQSSHHLIVYERRRAIEIASNNLSSSGERPATKSTI